MIHTKDIRSNYHGWGYCRLGIHGTNMKGQLDNTVYQIV